MKIIATLLIVLGNLLMPCQHDWRCLGLKMCGDYSHSFSVVDEQCKECGKLRMTVSMGGEDRVCFPERQVTPRPPECQHEYTQYINPRSPAPDKNGNVLGILIFDGVKCRKCGIIQMGEMK